MIAIPICLLAFAAGVALLIKVKTAGLGGLYRALSWLVILLSLLYMFCLVARGIVHHRHMMNMRNEREAQFKQFQDMRMKHFEQMKGDSTMMKGDSTSMVKDSTMKGAWHGHMMGGGGKMMGSCCADMACCGQMEHGGGGRGHHHHGGGMYGGGWEHQDGKDGKGNAFHYGRGNYMAKDSTKTAR